MDNQFNTTAVLAYLDEMHITYQFLPPYKHEFIGSINYPVRNKFLLLKTIFLLYALTDAIAKLNNVPRRYLA